MDERQGKILHVVKTTLFALALSALPLSALLITRSSDRSSIEPTPDGIRCISALVVAPLFENLCRIIVIEFMKLVSFRHAVPITLTTVGVIAGLIHLASGPWMGIAATIMFSTMAFTYMAWSDIPAGYRYLMTIARHILANTPASMAMAVLIVQNAR